MPTAKVDAEGKCLFWASSMAARAYGAGQDPPHYIMQRKTLLLALMGSLALLSSCSQEPAEQPGASENASETDTARRDVTQQTNPLTGTSAELVRIRELPSDAFFQEYCYPGAKVLDVKDIFGTPTVWLSSSDDYEKIDAFYKQKFTKPDGTIEGRMGAYYRMTEESRMQKAGFTKRVGGGCDIVLSM